MSRTACRKPRTFTKPILKVKKNAPATSQRTTSGSWAPKRGTLKNTIAPTAEAMGAVAALIASSIPAKAGRGARAHRASAAVSLLIGISSRNRSRAAAFARADAGISA